MDLRNSTNILEKKKIPTKWSGDLHPDAWSFICPICRIPRRVGLHARPQPRHYAQVFLTAAFFSLLTWKWFAWKGLVSFIPLWTIFEIAYRTQTRAALYCKRCGFDPYLFMIDSEWARKEVETYWRKKLEDKGIPFPEPKRPSGPRQFPQL